MIKYHVKDANTLKQHIILILEKKNQPVTKRAQKENNLNFDIFF